MYEGTSADSVESLSEEERVREYIRTFEGPAQHILDQLETNIQAGVYSHILGIDASGRIPALIVGKYISVRYREADRQPPAKLFAGPNLKGDSTPQLAELFADWEAIKRSGKRVLIVDDTIYRGTSLRRVSYELLRRGVPFEIAVFAAVNSDEDGIEQWRDFMGAKALYVGDYIYYGDEIEDEPLPIVKRRDLLGVKRVLEDPDDHEFVYKPVTEVDISDNALFREGRKEVSVLVDDLLAQREQKRASTEG
jgi:adenine/guanine phosphoribosyltransferase-like PRPP-binding protein